MSAKHRRTLEAGLRDLMDKALAGDVPAAHRVLDIKRRKDKVLAEIEAGQRGRRGGGR